MNTIWPARGSLAKPPKFAPPFAAYLDAVERFAEALALRPERGPRVLAEKLRDRVPLARRYLTANRTELFGFSLGRIAVDLERIPQWRAAAHQLQRASKGSERKLENMRARVKREADVLARNRMAPRDMSGTIARKLKADVATVRGHLRALGFVPTAKKRVRRRSR